MSKDRKLELDQNQHEYLTPTADRIVDQKMVGFISDYIIGRVEGENVLEMGVGDQIWTPKLVNKYPHVATIDGSNVLLSAMEKKLATKKWKPICSLFEDYSPVEKYDLVISTFVLEHVDDPLAIVRLVREKWLTPDGRIVVVVPHALSLHRRHAKVMGLISHVAELGETDRRMEHHRCMTCYEMEHLLVSAGYKILESKGMFTKAFPNKMLTQCTDQQLEGFFKLGLELPIEYSASIYFLAQVA